MFQIVRYVLILGALVGMLLGVKAWHISQQASGDAKTQTAVTPSPVPEDTDHIAALIVQLGTEERRLLWCQKARCQAQPAPAAASTDAVFDGQWWYYYTESEGESRRKLLQRIPASGGEPQTIVEQTPLAAPRDHIISPEGRYVAYWLDNTHDEERKLTELWVYDTTSQTSHVVAEKLTAPDIRTKIHWNRAASLLWFIADTAEPDQPDRLELVVASVNPPTVSARFKNSDWSALQKDADHTVLDISPSGTALAYVRQVSDIHNELVVLHEGREPLITTVRGTIPYLQWFEDNSLVYAVQDPSGITFWKQQGVVSQHVARSTGFLIAAQGRPGGNQVVFLEQATLFAHLQLLDIEKGKITDQGIVPAFGERTHVAKVELLKSTTSHVSGISTPLDDSQLAAFIDSHLTEIAATLSAKHIRLITTEEPNTIYVDFSDESGLARRFLLLVQDAVHPEWSVLARYESEGGEWKQVQGRGVSEPQPVRLYEWEESLKQWILKEDFEKKR